MSNRPKVSFGLTCYNQREWIGAALDSIVRMNKPFAYEVLVADDGSTDGSLEVIESYRRIFGERLVVLTGRSNIYANEGVSARRARNKGRLGVAAWGEYCLFGDGDDFWTDTEFLAEAVAELEKDSRLSAVIHGYSMLSPQGVTENVPIYVKEGLVNPYLYVANGYCHYGAFVFRNYILDNPDFFLRYGYDDWPLQLWVCRHGKLLYRNKRVYAWRQFENRGWEKIPEHIKSLGILSGFLKKMCVSPVWITIAEMDRWKRAFWCCLSNFSLIGKFLMLNEDKEFCYYRIHFLLRHAYPERGLACKYFWRLVLLLVLILFTWLGFSLASCRKLFCRR